MSYQPIQVGAMETEPLCEEENAAAEVSRLPSGISFKVFAGVCVAWTVCFVVTIGMHLGTGETMNGNHTEILVPEHSIAAELAQSLLSGVLMAPISWFFWRMLRPYDVQPWTRRDWIATSVLWALLSASMVMVLFIRHHPFSAFWILPTSVFGIMLLVLGGLLQLRACTALVALVAGANPWKWEPVLARGLAVVLCLLSLVYGYIPPATVDVDLHVRGLPAEADGYVLCMVCDVHAGPITSKAVLEGLAQEVQGLGCNVVLLNGDIGEGFLREREEAVKVLLPLSNVPDGAFFTLGNHEYFNYNDGDEGNRSAHEWAAWWNANGVRALINTHVDLPLNGTKWFTLAGIDDNLGDPDIGAAVANREDETIPIVLAAHQPYPHADDAHSHGVAAVLSGHTHAGQAYPSQILAASAAGGYLSGHYTAEGDVQVYVSEGTFGSEETRLRLFTRSEISRVRLRRSRSDGDTGGTTPASIALVLCYVLIATGLLAAIINLALAVRRRLV